MKKLFLALLIAMGFIAISTLSHAQNSFHSFMSDVNSATGITGNSYEDNVKKAEMLGHKNMTLWQLYELNIALNKTTGKNGTIIPPNTSYKNEGREIATTIATITPDTLIIIKRDTLTIVKENTQKVDSLQEVVNTLVIDNQTIATYNNSLQKGDILIADKRYQRITCVRTGKILDARKFDKLMDEGVLKHLKNRTWVYLPLEQTLTKGGLTDGFIIILLTLLALLGLAKAVGTPKPSEELIATQEELQARIEEIKKLKAELDKKDKEVKSLRTKIASQEATIIKLSQK